MMAASELIVIDCSAPRNAECVNDYVNTVADKFSYKSVDDVGDSDYLGTVDIKDAYRALHIHPDSSMRQGLAWDFGNGLVYLRDNRVSMGLSSSP